MDIQEYLKNVCKKCGVEGQIKACGPGVERIEEEIKEIFLRQD